MTNAKRNKEPEFARWKYSVKIDVEETKSRAENRGFSCRFFEGQPKNKKGKNGWGEGYPLPQYEITGAELPVNTKIHIAPKTTQIFFFGAELVKPSQLTCEQLEPLVIRIKSLADNLEKAEKIMNDLAAFADEEKGRFGQATRIYVKVPAMYRLIGSLKDTYQQLLDDIEAKFFDECNKAYDEMFQGKIFQARMRMDNLFKELAFFQRIFIESIRELKDPRADQWEADFNKALMYPFGFTNYQLKKTQPDKTP
jgi:hypothetical protein